ncbi:hypothetical protein A9Q84_03655 [Halobacteriovorax marinus]|uniref:Thioredoxin domain-containing protein n=1 Tax=Halobacteriovorax marinus TaxID=97084 RepID=A0A1Y5FAJ2_9BACT|nr:hypothetical protein A9Q84_03655 [Halobacteriovorax marinus]
MKILVFLLFTISLNSWSLDTIIQNSQLLSGKKVSSLAKAKKGHVIFFLSGACPCTKKHIPYLESLAKDHPDFRFLGVHSNSLESFAKAKKVYQDTKFPIAYDEDAKIANFFKAIKTPHVFVITNEDKTLYHGGVTNSMDPKRAKKFYLENALNDLKKSREVETKFAKALGCYIVR